MLSYSAVLLFCLGFFCFSFQLAYIFSSGTISLQLHHFHSHFWSSLRTEKRCLSSSQKSFFFAVCQHGVLKRFSKCVLFQLVCFISLSFTFASNSWCSNAASVPLVTLTSRSLLLNRLAMHGLCTIVCRSVQPGVEEGSTLSCCWHMDFYKHFPVSFNVSMLLGVTMLKYV